jgi:hypothetical protein
VDAGSGHRHARDCPDCRAEAQSCRDSHLHKVGRPVTLF